MVIITGHRTRSAQPAATMAGSAPTNPAVTAADIAAFEEKFRKTRSLRGKAILLKELDTRIAAGGRA